MLHCLQKWWYVDGYGLDPCQNFNLKTAQKCIFTDFKAFSQFSEQYISRNKKMHMIFLLETELACKGLYKYGRT